MVSAGRCSELQALVFDPNQRQQHRKGAKFSHYFQMELPYYSGFQCRPSAFRHPRRDRADLLCLD